MGGSTLAVRGTVAVARSGYGSLHPFAAETRCLPWGPSRAKSLFLPWYRRDGPEAKYSAILTILKCPCLLRFRAPQGTVCRRDARLFTLFEGTNSQRRPCNRTHPCVVWAGDGKCVCACRGRIHGSPFSCGSLGSVVFSSCPRQFLEAFPSESLCNPHAKVVARSRQSRNGL
jgi:hypothetical protein